MLQQLVLSTANRIMAAEELRRIVIDIIDWKSRHFPVETEVRTLSVVAEAETTNHLMHKTPDHRCSA